jgi:predicted HicB family RNase H-like nuclease
MPACRPRRLTEKGPGRSKCISVPEPISRRRYSGKFMVRVPPEVHRQLGIEAAEDDVSLNGLVSTRLSS